jgi:hypothetical protein
MVTHSNTNLPVRSLCTGERTGPAAFSDLWSYVTRNCILTVKYLSIDKPYFAHMPFFDSILNPRFVNDDSAGLQKRLFWLASPLNCHFRNATAAFPILPAPFW